MYLNNSLQHNLEYLLLTIQQPLSLFETILNRSYQLSDICDRLTVRQN